MSSIKVDGVELELEEVGMEPEAVRTPTSRRRSTGPTNAVRAMLPSYSGPILPTQPTDFIDLFQRLNDAVGHRVEVATRTTLGSVAAEPLRLHRCIMQKDCVLQLSHALLGPGGAALLTEYVRNAPQVTELLLDYNQFGDRGAKNVGSVLTSDHSIKVLSLDSNEVGGDGAETIASVVKRLPWLKQLQLSNNPLGDRGNIAIGGALSQCKYLSQLGLSNVGLSPGSVSVLAEAVRNHKHLAVLMLNRNPLGFEGLNVLFASVQRCPSLKTLDICDTGLDVSTCDGLCSVLRNSTSLCTVALSKNAILDVGASKIAKALEAAPKIHSVDMQSCGFSDAGFQDLVKVAVGNSRIKSLHLTGNALKHSATAWEAERVRHTARLDIRYDRVAEVPAPASPPPNPPTPHGSQRDMGRHASTSQIARIPSVRGEPARADGTPAPVTVHNSMRHQHSAADSSSRPPTRPPPQEKAKSKGCCVVS